MKTMERNTTNEVTEKAPVRAATHRTWWLLAAVAVLALAAGRGRRANDGTVR